MSRRYVHTCLRVCDPDASMRFYGAPDGYRIELIEGEFTTSQGPEA